MITIIGRVKLIYVKENAKECNGGVTVNDKEISGKGEWQSNKWFMNLCPQLN